MNYKALAAGAVLGFLMALVPACGGKSNCGPSNCTGCCDANGECIDAAVAGTSPTTCGASGNACSACAATQTCTAGACVTPTTNKDGGVDAGGGGCNPTSCPTGCCSGQLCLPGTTNTNCGAGGAACTACGTGGVSCVGVTGGGSCQAPDAGQPNPTLGIACTGDQDCAGLTNGICKKTTSLNSGVYENGFCTVKCTEDTQCGASGYCIALDAQKYGEEDSICWPKCDPNVATSCRADTHTDGSKAYACYTLGTINACWIFPPTSPDG